MILKIYLAFLGISFILLVIGYQFDSMLIKTIGFILLAMNSVPLLTDGIDYQSGHIDVTESNTVTRTYSYENFQNHTIGILLVLLGLFGFCYLVYDEYKDRQKRREES